MYGIGIDIVNISRIERLASDDYALDYVFTQAEKAEALKRKHPGSGRRLAAVFAVKEAFMKAVGTGWGNGVQWKDIEVINEGGRLSIRLYNRTKEICGDRNIFVSTSCTNDLAVAFVAVD